MILLKPVIPLLLAIICCIPSYSQNDSCTIKISLLTCGPGTELYSLFGHSALRVKDISTQSDIIYNYGTFDFNDPDFYVKFVKGKLLYYVSVERFDQFMIEYQMENRSILEQDLDLTCEENKRLFSALRINSREENKYYKYQFLFDNCSTRLRDIVARNNDDSVTFKRILPVDAPTFRDMIHMYLDRGKQYWSKFGIDLVLAKRIDIKVKNEEAMFLPDFLMKGFDSAVVKNESLVSGKKVVLQSVPFHDEEQSVTPLSVTIAFLVFGILLTFIRKDWALKAGNIFDIAYFLILGLTGCFLLFMWLGTDHELCRDNFNLLWALPTHFIMSFFILKRSPFIQKYFVFTAIFSFLLILGWAIIPQDMNSAFLPLVLLSGIRSAYRSMKK